MLTGTVNALLEPTIELSVLDAQAQPQVLEVVIDTGFNGFLTLPPARIAALTLIWQYRHQGLLADGTPRTFDVYSATILWDGQQRTVEVEATDARPLIGLALLKKHDLRIQVVHGGLVTITPLP